MHDSDFTLTLGAVLATALALGYATHRLGLSPIVGYLLAGVVVGPHTPGFVANQHLADQLSSFGVVLLMFGVGLHFDAGELFAVRRIALPGALGQCAFATGLGSLAAMALGWDASASLVFGLAISFTSTVVVTRVLGDYNALHTPVGHIAVGWLIVQDVIAVLVLVLMPALLGGPENEPTQLPIAIGLAAVKVAILIVVVLFGGRWLVPGLLRYSAASGSRELFTLTVLVVALGIALGSAELFGVSMALGAFLAGMVVGRSDFSVRAATEALPMRDAFAVLFFVSVGMLFDPQFIVQSPVLVLGALGVVMLGTPTFAFLMARWRGYTMRVAISLALALTQIGEFSFILALQGKNLKLLPDDATQALVAVALVTISLNPILYRLADPLLAWTSRRPRLWKWMNAHVQDSLTDGPSPVASVAPAYRAVVIGYGPVGRTVSRLLRENGIEPTIIEMNIDTVRRLRREGVPAVYGDATHHDTLKEAGVDEAASLILSSSGMRGSEEAIRVARELNPNVRILARSAYVRELTALQRAGAEVVFSGEGEVALALTEAILRRLGATPDQVDRERERVREELAGPKHAPIPDAHAMAPLLPSHTNGNAIEKSA